jgi:hypothetical protein
MPEETSAAEDPNLRFIRQLYETCLERYGEDHEQTRLLSKYISYLEDQEPRPQPQDPSPVFSRDSTFVPLPRRLI